MEMVQASHVRIELDLEAIPVLDGARDNQKKLLALTARELAGVALPSLHLNYPLYSTLKRWWSLSIPAEQLLPV